MSFGRLAGAANIVSDAPAHCVPPMTTSFARTTAKNCSRGKRRARGSLTAITFSKADPPIDRTALKLILWGQLAPFVRPLRTKSLTTMLRGFSACRVLDAMSQADAPCSAMAKHNSTIARVTVMIARVVDRERGNRAAESQSLAFSQRLYRLFVVTCAEVQP
jgi:hypothetical protein